jgi:MFS transporter, FHS family, L-fucose permease
LAAKSSRGTRQYPLALASTFALFTIWGLAHRVYADVSPQFTDFFQLTGTQAAWSQSVFTIAFFVLAIPAALFLRRFGYKLALVFGLASFSVGALLLYPAITQHEYMFFFGGVIVLGAGWAWLETSANPLIVEMGSPGTAVQRLNFAQAFYPLGVGAGVELGKWLAQSNLRLPVEQLAQAVVRPYVIVGLCVLLVAFLIENIDFPSVATERSNKEMRFRDGFRTLLSRPMFRMGVIALGAYILAHVVLWAVVFGYARHALPAASRITAMEVATWSLVTYGIGRFAGTAMMYWVEPNRLFAICAGACVVLTATAVAVGGMLGVFCLLATNFFMSIMYPTIFATTISGLGPLTKTASGMLVTGMGMAATLATLALNMAAKFSTDQLTVILPALCFGFLFVYSGAVRRAQDSVPPAARHTRLAPQQ